MKQESARDFGQPAGRPDTISAVRTGPEKYSNSDHAVPRILDAEGLYEIYSNDDVYLVDVRNPEQISEGFIPGAVVLDPRALYRSDGKTEGLMPYPAELASTLSATGIQPRHHVVVYDDETGVDATRLLWLLEAFGHEHFSLLSGGFEAWLRHSYPVSVEAVGTGASLYPVRDYARDVNRDKAQVLEAVEVGCAVIIDTRSLPEYNGLDIRADRGGRIPGALNIAWDELIDYYDTGEILPGKDVESLLLENGVDRSKPIIVYCQSNRRSAHTYIVLSTLGYNVSTYAGSWSEWGNDQSLPIEV